MLPGHFLVTLVGFMPLNLLKICQLYMFESTTTANQYPCQSYISLGSRPTISVLIPVRQLVLWKVSSTVVVWGDMIMTTSIAATLKINFRNIYAMNWLKHMYQTIDL